MLALEQIGNPSRVVGEAPAPCNSELNMELRKWINEQIHLKATKGWQDVKAAILVSAAGLWPVVLKP